MGRRRRDCARLRGRGWCDDHRSECPHPGGTIACPPLRPRGLRAAVGLRGCALDPGRRRVIAVRARHPDCHDMPTRRSTSSSLVSSSPWPAASSWRWPCCSGARSSPTCLARPDWPRSCGSSPIALALACFTQAVASWAVYTKAFSSLGRMRVAQGIAQSGFQLAFGVLQLGAIGLVLGDVASRFAGVGQLTRSTFRSLRSTVISRTSLRRSAGERWAFARVMTAASLLSAVSLQIPFLMIPPFFGLEFGGAGLPGLSPVVPAGLAGRRRRWAGVLR